MASQKVPVSARHFSRYRYIFRDSVIPLTSSASGACGESARLPEPSGHLTVRSTEQGPPMSRVKTALG